ncbi:MAG: aldo/keto reductase [Oscillospiraceae bacterium]|jgi:predicted aldo/keto reductase-like oxidoreductase|nr:aldo/keto reductase [Oscillospiraceae bacterium]
MFYKPLGNTGKMVSAVSFGGMRFRKEEYADGPERCAEIVLRARELGVNYFDTAPGYCNDQSEAIVGHAIKQMKEKPYVSTKCGLWMTDTAEGAYERILRSLERLHVDKLTVYNMWCIKNIDEYRRMTAPGGIYDGIRRARDEGLVEHICCSAHIDGKGLAAIAADGLVESVTLGYNALNFAYRRAGVKACHAAGLGVVTMNPLGGGMIPRHADLFSFLKSQPDETLVQSALRLLIGQKEISAALPGPGSIAELEECLSAADRERVVTEETLAALSERLGQELDTLCTGCSYCDECPVDIPIPKLLESYNDYILKGSYDAIGQRLRDHWGITAEKAADCVQCGQCETLCTQKLPIMQRLAEIAALQSK